LSGIYRFAGDDLLIINLGLGKAENEFYSRPKRFNAGRKSSLIVLLRAR
jgi:hypothetical protein